MARITTIGAVVPPLDEQGDSIRLERWCLFCISLAREQERRHQVIVVCKVQDCESPLHQETVISRLLQSYGNIRMLRNKQGQYRQKAEESAKRFYESKSM